MSNQSIKPNLETFLGSDLWEFAKASQISNQIQDLWDKIDPNFDQKISNNPQNRTVIDQIKFILANQIIPTQIILKKETKNEDLQNQNSDQNLPNSIPNSNPNFTNSKAKIDKKTSKIDDFTDSNLPNLKPLLINGKKIEIPKNQEEIVKIQLEIAKDPKFKVISKTEKSEKINPKPPFITSSLQQAASSTLGFGPKITMQLAQKLYEGTEINGKPTGLITYMRTDSFNLSSEFVNLCRNFIKENHSQFLPISPTFYKSKKSAQEAHEAIRPANLLLTPSKIKTELEPKLWKLYNLIWCQTVACQMTPEIRQRISFELENSLKSRFGGSVYWTTSLGWKVLFEKDKIE